MRTLVILDHPYTLASAADVEHERSFSAAVAAAAIRGARSAGHEVDVIDLAADGFDPVMSADDLRAWRLQQVVDPVVADYQQRILAANHLAFVFPIWWEAMPAATKGFLDRVLTQGVAYEEIRGAKGNPFRNLMTELRGVSVQTVMTTPHPVYRWWFGDPVTKIMFRGTFGKIGVRNLQWHNYANVSAASDRRRAALLAATERRFATCS